MSRGIQVLRGIIRSRCAGRTAPVAAVGGRGCWRQFERAPAVGWSPGSVVAWLVEGRRDLSTEATRRDRGGAEERAVGEGLLEASSGRCAAGALHSSSGEEGAADAVKDLPTQEQAAAEASNSSPQVQAAAEASNSSPQEQAAAEASTELSPLEQAAAEASPAQVVGPNYARNKFFRDAYREATPSIGDEVGRKLSSPYVPLARDYPSAAAAKDSRQRAASMARLQVAHDRIWSRFGTRVQRFEETFRLLKAMTGRRDGAAKMAAMKIVLPPEWDMDVESKRVEFLDSATGLVARLRMSADHRNESAVILRGRSSVLAKAADALVKACPAVEVFQLGDVAAFGYEVKQLWPVIEDAPDGGSSLPKREREGEREGNGSGSGSGDNHRGADDFSDNTIWVHREHEPYWTDQPYEKTPRPREWTADSFNAYIAALAFGRLRPHLAVPLYSSESVDVAGVRINLMLEAFLDPAARPHVTPGTLKIAMAFMARAGGHRADADRLLRLAEQWGMPMDTDLFNIMLEAYAAAHDVAFFHKLLLRMQARFFRPDVRSWLLFLRLVQRDAERRQVIVAMYDLGFFADPATRRGVARTMAAHDAYAAFRAGKKLDTFVAEQDARYGGDWFTADALACILTEFFRFHDVAHPRYGDFKTLVQRPSEDGRPVDMPTLNLVIQRGALPQRNWAAALWALEHAHRLGIEPDPDTFDLLIALAVRSRSPGALGVVFFHAVLSRMLRLSARARMRDILTRRNAPAFWLRHAPKILSGKMARHLRFVQRTRKINALAAVEFVILRDCDGFRPVKSLAHNIDVALRTMDAPFHQQLKMQAHKAVEQEQAAGNHNRNDDDTHNDDIDNPISNNDDNDNDNNNDDHGSDIRRRNPFRPSVRDMAIRLRAPDRDGQPAKMTVHLDAYFEPNTMIKWWRRPGQQDPRGHASPDSSPDTVDVVSEAEERLAADGEKELPSGPT